MKWPKSTIESILKTLSSHLPNISKALMRLIMQLGIMFLVILIELRYQECSVSPEILIDSKDLSRVRENQPSINGGHNIWRLRECSKKLSASIKRLKILEV